MNDIFKSILLVLLIIYILSPVDCVPGPIDDLIALVFALSVARD